MKNKDIAEAMDVSLRTVEAHMYKALKFCVAGWKVISGTNSCKVLIVR